MLLVDSLHLSSLEAWFNNIPLKKARYRMIFLKGDCSMKKYTKPEMKKHAELKSVTFSSH